MMSILDYSIRLRELSDDYANQRIMLDEYRSKRKEILDDIDKSINGLTIMTEDEQTQDQEQGKETAIGMLNRAIGVFEKTEDGNV